MRRTVFSMSNVQPRCLTEIFFSGPFSVPKQGSLSFKNNEQFLFFKKTIPTRHDQSRLGKILLNTAPHWIAG